MSMSRNPFKSRQPIRQEDIEKCLDEDGNIDYGCYMINQEIYEGSYLHPTGSGKIAGQPSIEIPIQNQSMAPSGSVLSLPGDGAVSGLSYEAPLSNYQGGNFSGGGGNFSGGGGSFGGGGASGSW